MFEDLNKKEIELLKLYIKFEKDRNIESKIDKFDVNGEMTDSLIEKGYLNGVQRKGVKGDIVSDFNYGLTGYLISDKTIESFNLRKEYPTK